MQKFMPSLLGCLTLGSMLATNLLPAHAELKEGLFGAADVITVEGSLEKGDEVNTEDDSYYDEIAVPSPSGAILLATMTSQNVDPYLFLYGPDDVFLWDDDDAGPADGAFVAARILESGDHELVANSFEGGEIGSYTVQYTTIAEPDWQETIQGNLEPGDDFHPEDDTWMDLHTVEGRRGEVLLVEMTSDVFDSYLQILDPEGDVVAQGDDQAGDTNALAVLYLDDRGTYTIRANAYSGAKPGPYTLRYVKQ